MLPSGLRQKFSCRSASGWVVELILEKEIAQLEAVSSPTPTPSPCSPFSAHWQTGLPVTHSGLCG